MQMSDSGNTTGTPIPLDVDTNYAYFTGFALAVASSFLIAWSYILKKFGLERYAARSERQDGYSILEPSGNDDGTTHRGNGDVEAEGGKAGPSGQHLHVGNDGNVNGGSPRRRAAEGSVGYILLHYFFISGQ